MSSKQRIFKLSSLLSKLVYGNDGEMDELTVLRSIKKRRKKNFRHNRLDLPEHMSMCLETGGFERRYHMLYDTYIRLVEILEISVDV